VVRYQSNIPGAKSRGRKRKKKEREKKEKARVLNHIWIKHQLNQKRVYILRQKRRYNMDEERTYKDHPQCANAMHRMNEFPTRMLGACLLPSHEKRQKFEIVCQTKVFEPFKNNKH
jgi:hypothetical protein